MKWTSEEEYLLRTNLNLSNEQISALIQINYDKKVPGFPVKRTANAVRVKIYRENLSKDSNNSYDEAWNYIINVAKEYRSKSVKHNTGLTRNKATKIISFSDLHIPFFNWEDMKNALNEHKDANIVVLNGDILDAYIFSTFSKSKNIAALKEYKVAFDLVHFLSDNFEKVILVSGNHDYRTTRALKTSGFTDEATKVYRPDLLFRIANGERLDHYGNLEEKLSFDNVYYDVYDSWYSIVGKTIFCHPSGFGSKYPGATVVKLLDHFMHRMESSSFDSIVVGHTHKVYKGIVSNKLLIEQGAMCHKLPYQFRADLRFKNAMNGYAIIYQDSDGNTNYNDSGSIYLGSHLPVKKGI